MSEVPPPPVATIPPAVPPPPLPSTCPVSYDLRDKELLSLLLAPNLEESLTPGTLIGADNVALFRLLPLILAAIHHLGRSSSHRSSFVSLISVLRCRIVACRGLKLRFLLLLKNPAFSQHWHVKMVHRRDCYTSAHHVLQDMAHDMDKQKQSSLSLALALQIPKMKSASSRLIQDWLKDKAMVIAFVARKLLHPHLGIYTRPLMWHMRPVKAGFYATELVDGIMERANFHDRNDAIQLAQRLLDMRIILKMGGKGKKFVDDKRRIYQSCFTLQQKDNGHCRVVMECGKEVCSWDVLGGMDDRVVIKHIEVQMPMDMIDLQSYEFWTNSVYVKNVKSGHRYGYRAITHPMFCGDVKPGCTAPENSKIILENDGSGYSDSNASDEGLSFSLLSASQLSGLSLDEVNLIHQDTSVIGSVVVRKVFSSIARPMIIELRLPLENAELEDDDQHVTMRPGLLVKEGDNLMQDLGVEIMFQCFNYVWNQSTSLKDEYGMTPFSISYEVFPTSPTQGFMEGVTGLTSLKEFNWKKWHNEYGKDKNRVNDMLRSAVGSYIGAYVVGGRDRHFDNVLVKDDRYVLHIDFGFLMGTSPPIDGPRIAIAPQMEAIFRKLNVWDKFVAMFVDSFLVLRAEAPAIIRASVMIFSKAGFEEEAIRAFLQGKFSLNLHDKEKKAGDVVKRQLVMSSGDIKAKFKAFSHEHIDPAWYGLLEKGFPPAVAIMKLVDAKEQKAAKKLALTSGSDANVSEEQKIQL